MKTNKLAVMFLLAGGVALGGGMVQEAQAQMPLSNPLHPANPLNPIYHDTESAAEREARLQRQEERRAALEARKQALFEGIGDFNKSAEDLRPLAKGLKPSPNDLRFLEDCRSHITGGQNSGQLDAQTTQAVIDCMTGKARDARNDALREAAPMALAVLLLLGGVFGGGYVITHQGKRRKSAPKH